MERVLDSNELSACKRLWIVIQVAFWLCYILSQLSSVCKLLRGILFTNSEVLIRAGVDPKH